VSITEKIKSLSKINFDDLYNDFLGLERNQQIMAVAGIALVALVILFIPISCVSSKISEKEDQYLKFSKMASEFYGIQQQYTDLKKSFDQIKKASSILGVDPLKRVLYNITDEIGIDRSRIDDKTSSPIKGELFTTVGKDVTIKNIRFDQVVDLLSQLVNFKDVPITIKTLKIKTDKKDRQVMREIKLSISTIRPNR